jgi:hypothetical protein
MAQLWPLSAWWDPPRPQRWLPSELEAASPARQPTQGAEPGEVLPVWSVVTLFLPVGYIGSGSVAAATMVRTYLGARHRHHHRQPCRGRLQVASPRESCPCGQPHWEVRTRHRRGAAFSFAGLEVKARQLPSRAGANH